MDLTEFAMEKVGSMLPRTESLLRRLTNVGAKIGDKVQRTARRAGKAAKAADKGLTEGAVASFPKLVDKVDQTARQYYKGGLHSLNTAKRSAKKAYKKAR